MISHLSDESGADWLLEYCEKLHSDRWIFEKIVKNGKLVISAINRENGIEMYLDSQADLKWLARKK